jgi:aryl-alcohol dehydrogenase-like predicted oxidoreductase
MKYRTFGRTGVSVSDIGFGAWAIGGSWGPQSDDESIKALNTALDLGCTFIDTAAGYGNGRSERLIGQVLDERKLRDKVYVATKTPPASGPWPPSPYCKWDDRFSEKYIRGNVEERLSNLKTDRLDLLQLHTWTRAWNDDPQPLLILQKLQKEGKLRHIGLSTPEHDQNCFIQLMRAGLLDAVQVIYNIFEQEPAAQFLPVAKENNVAVIVRVAFDEGALTGKFTTRTHFAEDDFRRNYFAGDRMARTLERVDKIKADVEGSGYTLPQVALRFALDHPAVSTVIPGIRTVAQAQMNCAVSDLAPLPQPLTQKLHNHAWRRAFWYGGK